MNSPYVFDISTELCCHLCNRVLAQLPGPGQKVEVVLEGEFGDIRNTGERFELASDRNMFRRFTWNHGSHCWGLPLKKVVI